MSEAAVLETEPIPLEIELMTVTDVCPARMALFTLDSDALKEVNPVPATATRRFETVIDPPVAPAGMLRTRTPGLYVEAVAFTSTSQALTAPASGVQAPDKPVPPILTLEKALVMITLLP